MADEARRRSAEILADKINQLLDTLRTEAGEPFDFATIQQGLKGPSLVPGSSRTRPVSSCGQPCRSP